MAYLIPKHNTGYKIQKGDTLSKIAKQYNVSINELARLNNIKDINKINAGTILKLPNQKQNVSLYKKEYPKLQITNNYTNLSWTPKDSNLSSNEVAKQEALNKVAGSFDRKENARKLQTMLKEGFSGFGKGYYSGNIDGDWGKGSKAALRQALGDAGYDQNSIDATMDYVNKNIYSRDFSISKAYNFDKKARSQQSVSKLTPKSSSTVSYQYSVHPMFGTPLNVNVDIEGLKELKKQGTVRQYTAAQNTLEDVVKAPIKRGIGTVLGSDVANFVMPTKEYNEDHLSGELYNWLQEAIDKKWPIEERQKYFEQNPDAEVKKGWHGRVNDKVKVSDYQKYYGVPYTGPMGHGIKETMFGAGIPQAQGTLGSFNIVYTKDGAYIQDDWDFGVGKDFGHDNLLQIIRSSAEKLGSQENSDIEPIRKINAFIKYR